MVNLKELTNDILTSRREWYITNLYPDANINRFEQLKLENSLHNDELFVQWFLENKIEEIIMKDIYNKGFEAGRVSKVKEMHKALGIEWGTTLK